MSGPEHYLTAEHLIAEAGEYGDEHEGTAAARAEIYARAQVHATLAMAAATAMASNDMNEWEHSAWAGAAGTRAPRT